MKKINFNIISSILLVIAVLIVLFAPFLPDSTLGNDSTRLFLKIILYFCAGFGLIVSIFPYFKKESKLDNPTLLFLISFMVYYLLTIFNQYNGAINISGFLMLILCIAIGLQPDKYKLYSFRMFQKFWVVICAISAFLYLAYVLKLPIPYSETSYYSLLYNKNDLYINYGITFLYKTSDYLRLCGICNEAGYFGTICALILCANKIDLRKKENIIIFIAGLFTFSFAFFILLLLYLLLNSWKNIKVFICILLLIISYVYILPNIKTGNDNIDYLLNRFIINDEGKLNGDNRSNELLDKEFYDTIRNKTLFGKGVGYVSHASIKGVGSYKVYVIEYGLIGCIVMWGLLLISSLKKNNHNIYGIIFISIFFINIYQRANIMIPPYLLILYGGVLYINYRMNTKQLSNN